jgi:hypothetical protein
MTLNLAIKPTRRIKGSHRPPWRTDVQAARQAALLAKKPCVLILNVDNSAL